MHTYNSILPLREINFRPILKLGHWYTNPNTWI